MMCLKIRWQIKKAPRGVRGHSDSGGAFAIEEKNYLHRNGEQSCPDSSLSQTNFLDFSRPGKRGETVLDAVVYSCSRGSNVYPLRAKLGASIPDCVADGGPSRGGALLNGQGCLHHSRE